MKASAWLLLVVVCVSGCIAPMSRKASRSSVGFARDGRPVVKQSGDVEAPARANTETAVTTLPLPAGSVVSVTPRSTGTPAASHVTDQVPESAGGSQITVTLSQPSELRTETRRDVVEAAKTYAPPLPPSPAEIARGTGALWCYGAAALLGVGAILSFAVFKFPRAAVWLSAGAVGMALLGAFIGWKYGLVAGLIGAVAAFAYWHSWHVMKHPKESELAAPRSGSVDTTQRTAA